MSLWSISAAKKKEEVPGTSKWIRKELFTLHDLMVKDVQQFAYSVSAELTWIDEQMDEILRDDGKNPRLLLESPAKLRGEDSPIKQIRDHALTLKSPVKEKSILKEIDVNILRLSPIRFEKLQSPVKNTYTKPSPIKIPQKETYSENKENNILDELELDDRESSEEHSAVSSVDQDIEVKVSEELVEEKIELIQKPISPVEDVQVDLTSNIGAKEKNNPESEEKSISFGLKRLPSENPYEDDDQDDYDASMEDNSFQAIKTAIRKSIINKTKSSEETDDHSFKSASEEVPNVDIPEPSVKDIFDKSVETVKMPLKDDNTKDDPELKTRKSSHTPPHYSHRESQGFALLPHRGPLTVKSAKKPEEGQKTRKSLFDVFFSLPTENKAKEGTGKVATSLYPTLDLVDKVAAPTLKLSPIVKTRIPSPQKPSTSSMSPISVKQKTHLIPLKSKIGSGDKPTLMQTKLESPTKNLSPMKKASPISNLFSSVGSTLRKAKSKFIKETQFIFDDDKVHKPDRDSIIGRKSKISKVEVEVEESASKSPKKKSVTQDQLETLNNLIIPQLQHEGVSLQRQKTPELHEPLPKAPQLESPTNEDSTFNDEDDDKRESIKFSPVNSIYGSLRQEMNSKSPMKKEENTIHRPKSLARMSLSKPQDNIKSNGKGLTAVSLEPKTNKIQPQKSFSNEQSSLKRKTDEDQLPNNKSQAYRKIGTKIVPPNITQLQSGNDLKRYRTAAGQVQKALNKRASRVSIGNSNNQEERIEPKPKQTHVINSQALMKTAVLQHARLNNEMPKPMNSFQSTSGITNNSHILKSPVTPIAPTVLPEIFSESDDDDEGSVLKDWANSPELRNILLKQQYVDPDKVFGPIAPLHMEEIFKSSTSRIAKLKNRGSSAQWTGKDALTFQELENYKKKFKK